jgi:hypothetical protein
LKGVLDRARPDVVLPGVKPRHSPRITTAGPAGSQYFAARRFCPGFAEFERHGEFGHGLRGIEIALHEQRRIESTSPMLSNP